MSQPKLTLGYESPRRERRKRPPVLAWVLIVLVAIMVLGAMLPYLVRLLFM